MLSPNFLTYITYKTGDLQFDFRTTSPDFRDTNAEAALYWALRLLARKTLQRYGPLPRIDQLMKDVQENRLAVDQAIGQVYDIVMEETMKLRPPLSYGRFNL